MDERGLPLVNTLMSCYSVDLVAVTISYGCKDSVFKGNTTVKYRWS